MEKNIFSQYSWNWTRKDQHNHSHCSANGGCETCNFYEVRFPLDTWKQKQNVAIPWVPLTSCWNPGFFFPLWTPKALVKVVPQGAIIHLAGGGKKKANDITGDLKLVTLLKPVSFLPPDATGALPKLKTMFLCFMMLFICLMDQAVTWCSQSPIQFGKNDPYI